MNDHCSFVYTSVTVYKDRQIGVGAYGTVYLAKCDDLPCAAKIIHRAFFESADPGSKRIMERFKQECNFISKIRHPNIVQYLGIHRDEESNMPVLLMELLDDNLTNFLNNQIFPLSFLLEVNICHDISLAVAYLHSNNIIHRDLSSNNVLLVGNAARAKVVDFGVAKLNDNSKKCITQIPGTEVYMAPEIIKNNPECSDKVDCYSVGVLIVQILTRLYPEPGPRTETRPDTSSPTKTVEVPIPDVERRKNHIDLIDPNNPLLPIAKQCLSYSDEDRPTSKVLCQRLAKLKEYEMVQRSPKQRKISQYSDQDDSREVSMPSLDLTQEVLEAKEVVIQKLEAKIKALESHLRALRETDTIKPKREIGVTPVPMALGSVAVDGALAYFRPSKSRDVHVFDSSSKEWSCTPTCRRSAFSLAIIDGFLTAVGGYDDHHRDTASLLSLVGNGKKMWWVEHFPSMPTQRSFCAVAVSEKFVVVAGGSVGSKQVLGDVELLDIKSKRWLKTSKLMMPLSEATVTIVGDHIYLVGGSDKSRHWSHSVYTSSLSSLEKAAYPANTASQAESPAVWVRLSDIPVSRSFCTVIRDSLLAVCGKRDGLHTDVVLGYKPVSNSWERVECSCFARSRCLVAALPGDRIMIVGGWGNSGQIIQSYEMVDISLIM